MSDEFDQKMQLGADLPEPEPGSSAERMFAEGDASLDRIQKSLMAQRRGCVSRERDGCARLARVGVEVDDLAAEAVEAHGKALRR